jgi:RNA polymerase sigma-70 factor (ECF subfamily)
MEVPDRREVLTADGSAIGVRGLFEAHADGVYTLGFRMLGDYHAAEDLVQETFVTVLRRLGTFRGEGSLAGWLYRIAYRNAIALIRKRRDLPSDPAELPEVVDVGASVEDRVLVGELSAALDRAVARLDPDQRAAFVLRDVEGLSTAETAAALDVTVSAVKMRLSRARHFLRTELKEFL